MPQQPAGLASNKGVILSINMNVGGDLAEIVIPCATDDTLLTAANRCQEACAAAENELFPLLTAAMSSSAYIRYVQGQGMDDGMIPYRKGYNATAFPGTISGGTVEAHNGALVTFYADPADLSPGQRMRHSRMILPGVPQSALTTEGWITAGHQLLLMSLASQMQLGFASAGVTPPKFYRVLASKKRTDPPSTSLIRLSDQMQTRWYAGIQRRRIKPL